MAGTVILGTPAFADNILAEGQDSAAASLETTASDTSLLGGKSNANSPSSDTSLQANEMSAAISSIPDNLLALSDGDSSVILSGSEESRVTWTELTEAPADGTSNVVTVNLLDDVVKYYRYEYNKPEDYTVSEERINDTLVSANVNKVVFEGMFSPDGKYGGAIYRNKGSIAGITGGFINNYASSSGSYASGGRDALTPGEQCEP